MKFIQNRPVLFWGSITSFAEAVIGFLLVFDFVDWTGDQVGQVMILIAAVGTSFIFIMQGQVTPTANPRDDAGNPLTPGPIGSVTPEELPEI